MQTQFNRTERLLGTGAMERLASSRVAVFGIGGVGGYVCEALVRSGIGAFELIDRDRVDETNLNRQIIALHSTIGRYKTEVMRERMLDIAPGTDIRIRNTFFLPDTADSFRFTDYDYIVDAVDTVSAKIELVLRAQQAGTPIISAMGAGNKLDPSRFRAADIYSTGICPLARVMRRELRKRGVTALKVVYSDEAPCTPADSLAGDPAQAAPTRKAIPGSTAFAPAAAGLVIAAEVVKDLTLNTPAAEQRGI